MLAYLCRYCVSGDDHGGASNTCSWMLLFKDSWIYYVRNRGLDKEGFAGQGCEGISMDTSCNLTMRLNSVSQIWGFLHDYLGYWFANGNDKRLHNVDFQIGQSITIMDCFRSTNLDAHVYYGDATWVVLFSPWRNCYEVSFLPMHAMLSLVSSRIDFMVTDGWYSWLGMDRCSTRLEARVDKGWPIWSRGIRSLLDRDQASLPVESFHYQPMSSFCYGYMVQVERPSLHNGSDWVKECFGPVVFFCRLGFGCWPPSLLSYMGSQLILMGWFVWSLNLPSGLLVC
ncbi:hypothetical protein E3N88_40624 [Mikania micrantha]|uniref:Uncharacterized protein n=1 Tax=Mikania micrantha TaxID=192012 RepID=A0A5N6LN91_9ASTR|nr:hypothetical protein E3N88_40624 [Mikania micrantha]